MIPGVRTIAFVKASACGNDFVLIDASQVPAHERGEVTRKICNRHRGVGADGVEWMLPHSSANIEIHFINADGSEAEISGNGTRCVAAYLFSEQGKEKITIQTGAGLKTCMLTSHSNWEYEFEMAMGTAEVSKKLVVKTQTVETCGITVSTGNPHYVIFVEQFPNEWQSLAAEVQRS